MKYYSYSESLGSRYRKPLRPKSSIVPRESVPITINMLDVLLSIWIAEAILESEPREMQRPRRAQKKPTPPIERRARWFPPDVP